MNELLSSPKLVRVRIGSDSPVWPSSAGAQVRCAEQYRIICTKIFLREDQPRMLVVSSAGPADGKTVTSINIAGALADRNEADVLLVEADLRRSSIAELLGLPRTVGLMEVLRGECELQDALLRIEQYPRLHLLQAGLRSEHASELLGSARWLEVCERLRSAFRFTVFDAPPIGFVADYELIEAVCDGVIAVVRPDHTNRAAAYRMLDVIPGRKRIGVVLNNVPDWFLWRSHDYYYYGSKRDTSK